MQDVREVLMLFTLEIDCATSTAKNRVRKTYGGKPLDVDLMPLPAAAVGVLLVNGPVGVEPVRVQHAP